jgi:hypothetical protein
LASRENVRAVRGYAECVVIKHVDGLIAAAAAHCFSSFVLGDGCQVFHRKHHCLDSFLPEQGPRFLKAFQDAMAIMLDIGPLANIRLEEANQSEDSLDLSRWYDAGGWH